MERLAGIASNQGGWGLTNSQLNKRPAVNIFYKTKWCMICSDAVNQVLVLSRRAPEWRFVSVVFGRCYRFICQWQSWVEGGCCSFWSPSIKIKSRRKVETAYWPKQRKSMLSMGIISTARALNTLKYMLCCVCVLGVFVELGQSLQPSFFYQLICASMCSVVTVGNTLAVN